jgi:phage shock protein B
LDFFSELFRFMTVPMIIFMVIVAPIWITMHYKSVNRANQGLSLEERELLDDLISQSEQLAARIDTLESLLDERSEHWRSSEEPKT